MFFTRHLKSQIGRAQKAACRLVRLRVEPLETRELLSSLVGSSPLTLNVGPLQAANTQAVYSQPPSASGGLIASSWVDPNGSDADMYVYDNFTLSADAAITEVDWRGGYLYGAAFGRANNFTVTFFDSIAGGSQPLVTNPQLPETYLAKFDVGGIAGETPAGTVGGTPMYDYQYVLPSAFQAQANHVYWIRIEASQLSYPDWGIAVGTGANNQHFQFSTGAARFSFAGSDAAFTLLTSTAATATISASESPMGAGTISGVGAYPIGTTATVTASPNTGYGFVNWTENGQPVSSSSAYSFTVSGDRTLVANFTPAATISVAASPAYGGNVTGSGTYNTGSTATVVAAANAGFEFVNWTEGGVPVSMSASYSFTADVSRSLVANFALLTNGATFDFDSGTPAVVAHQSMPSEQTFNGVTAYFSSPNTYAGGFSVQSDATTQFHLSQFSGNYLYPNSVYSPILDIHFNRHLTNISFTFATADFQQVEIPTTLQLTAYDVTTANPPVGSATAHGTYAGDTMPMGSLSFASATPFDVVEIKIPPTPLAASGFLIDNIVVTTTSAQIAPTITWPSPGSIVFGTPLSSVQLGATADVPGTFNYVPAIGTVLSAGTHPLAVTFTPTDTVNYSTVTANNQLVVNKAAPIITWPTPAEILYREPLSATQLNATANMPGVFVYAPAAETILAPGSQTLSVTFSPSDTTNYAPATANVQINVVNHWHNYQKPMDADGDGIVAPRDLTTVISYLNGYGASQVPANATVGWHYCDVTNDGYVAPLDLVQIITHLNAYGAGEGEVTIAAAPADVVFQQLGQQQQQLSDLSAIFAAEPMQSNSALRRRL